MIIINQIKISNDSYSFISNNGKEKNVLSNLNKINIFVGENNSGKSRFLRFLVAEKDLEFIPNNEDFLELTTAITCLKQNVPTALNSTYAVHELNDLNKLVEEIEIKKFIKPNEEITSKLEKIRFYIEYLDSYPQQSLKDINFTDQDSRNLSNILRQCLKNVPKPIKKIEMDYKFSKIYIPILRGLRTINFGGIDFSGMNFSNIKKYKPPSDVDNDAYKFRTLIDYFSSEVEKDPSFLDTIFTGLNTYREVNKRRSSGKDEYRELISEFEDYLSKNFFLNEKVEIIPGLDEEGEKNDVITVKIGNESGTPIYELGDGIQSIIIITLPLFLIKDNIGENENVLVFIEEPEHLLHPSLQRKLIETFNDDYFDKFQFFFTTHSNHFLDISLDFDGISMFTVSKKLDDNNNPHFKIKNVSFGDDNLLKQLGVRYSSVFLPNCNIWIEGVTDKRYFRHFFDLYQNYEKTLDKSFKKFQEEQHYSFFQYNGSDLVNLLDLNLDKTDEKLNRIFLIKDRDDNNNNAIIGKLDELLGDKFKLLNCREVENLLKKETILKIIQNDSRCKGLELNVNFDYSDYKDERIGGFLDKIVLKGQKKVYEKNNTGKLNNKTNFCSRAIKNISRWDEVSPEAQEICKKLYMFIKSQNKL